MEIIAMKDNRTMKMSVKSSPPPAAMAVVAELLLSIAAKGSAARKKSRLGKYLREYEEECFVSGKNAVRTSDSLEWTSSSLLEESTTGLQEFNVDVVQQPPK
ncbi:hypothetical protein Fot_03711 [Forsythia ovata]|uniref:Uncharacterized protein n=1 Tax=Forsythia ovata TaxID=205694 RepID=A0ABD1XAG8_9LAMI